LLAAGAMGNVFMLDAAYMMGYLTTTAFNLFVMAAFLAIPDAKRLFDAIVLGRAVPAVTWRPLVTDVRVRRLGLAVGLALVGHGAYLAILSSDRFLSRGVAQPAVSPLFGAYEVETFSRNGQQVPATLGESRWRYFLVERTGYATAWTMSDSIADFLTSVDVGRAELRLVKPPAPDASDHFGLGRYSRTPRYEARYWYAASYQAALKDAAAQPGAEYGRLVYTRLPADRLEVSGRLGGDSVAMTLHRHDRSDLLLLKWTERWTHDVGLPATNVETPTPSAPWRKLFH